MTYHKNLGFGIRLRCGMRSSVWQISWLSPICNSADLRIESIRCKYTFGNPSACAQVISEAARRNVTSDAPLRRAIHDYLRDEACVIFVIDQDSPKSLHQRRQEPNSLINQIEAVINEPSLAGKVFLALAVQELEAWLLIDCLRIFSVTSLVKRAALTRKIAERRVKPQTNPSFSTIDW